MVYSNELIPGKLYMTPYPTLLNGHKIEIDKPKIDFDDTLMFVGQLPRP